MASAEGDLWGESINVYVNILNGDEMVGPEVQEWDGLERDAAPSILFGESCWEDPDGLRAVVIVWWALAPCHGR
jgi:hypothetical protein